METNYTIHKLLPGEYAIYKDVRLEALRLEPAFFSKSLEEEKTYPDELWQNRLFNTGAAFFKLCCNNEVIGITGIVIQKDDEGEDVGYLGQSYIRKEHRGKGLSRMLYEARINWAREKGLKKLTIGHMERNMVSRSAIAHFGFVFTHSVESDLLNGEKSGMLFYELVL